MLAKLYAKRRNHSPSSRSSCRNSWSNLRSLARLARGVTGAFMRINSVWRASSSSYCKGNNHQTNKLPKVYHLISNYIGKKAENNVLSGLLGIKKLGECLKWGSVKNLVQLAINRHPIHTERPHIRLGYLSPEEFIQTKILTS